MPALTVKRQSLDRARSRLTAELGVESERYQDVVSEIKKIIFAYNARLTIEERSLLSIAYKNLTNNLRNSWRIVSTLESQIKQRIRSPQREREERLVRLQREKIESDLLDTCNDIVDLLDRYLLLAATPGEETVFYSKMKGDYYRYLAEFGPVKDRGRYGEVSLQAYKAAYKRALATLHPLDPTRLGLALNFSVFYHDVKGSPTRACHLAKSAFDDAIQSLNPTYDTFSQSLRDSLSILQLLRDDLLLWVEEKEAKES